MAKLKVLLYPNPFLHTKAKPVVTVDDVVRQHVDDMLEAMHEQEGCGLAAIQVGIPLRILTMDASRENKQPEVLINPEIIRREGSICVEEGCLSFPGISIEVPRAEKIWVKALNREGEAIEFVAEDLRSRCIQHEIDHLDGIVFTDRLSKLKRERANKKVLKFVRAYGLDREAS